ncbi:metal-dependent hydrolase [Falsigemmobacter faecalis]|uniref:UPF0173 metal-dependent hydrolase EG244_18355 n=1 Tax=Falsigemmobacter faecalis TaxID=2488730 RepID=A0A3P3D4M9_9RHOB|nr:metal-dependent hydrolase [Falsigemmobacter faecalis]RRH69360.1 metal-dependent hydrolase [Falsigemmobacter faecalis]
MKIIWLGHAGFRIEIGDQVLLIDPWLGNPLFPAERRAEALAGATAILVSHGHSDHLADAAGLSKDLGIPVAGKFDLTSWLEKTAGVTGSIGFNNGGTIKLGSVNVTMVAASHSSSVMTQSGPVYLGSEAGYMIEHDGRTIYFSGDTDVMADMAIFADLHNPEVGILSAGGHYTMDMKRAAYACRKFFHFRTVIPCHYKTFPALEQTADDLRAGVSHHINVIEPEVLVAIEL